MKRKLNLLCFGVGAFEFLFSFFVFTYTNDSLHLMLTLNVVLAMAPLLLSQLFSRSNRPWLQVIVFCIWLLMYPNTFYVLTDAIHLNHEWFYHQSVTNPIYSIPSWLAYFNVLCLSIFGVLVGVVGYLNVEEKVFKYFSIRFKPIFIIGISLLTSMGIYIGRFLRFNSWDILRPVKLLKQILLSIQPFSVFFVLMFAFVIGSLLLFASWLKRA